MPKLFSDAEAVVDEIIRDVGKNLVVGLPLGLGKANHVINALYARAAADRAINLTFFSALTLEKPRPDNLLERRFIGAVIDRLFGGYPDLAYAGALHAGALPPNIKVIEGVENRIVFIGMEYRAVQTAFGLRRSLDDWRQHVRLSLCCHGAIFSPGAPRVFDGPENGP